MPITLTGRLLCASKQAYMITTTDGETPPSPVTPAPPPSTLVGWLAAPLCYVAGDEEVNAALVGETATEIIVAFRGTEPFDSPDRGQMILDWADDVNALLVKDAATNMPGLVHAGFLGALDSLWGLIWPRITAVLTANPGKPLYITGHSKGGGIAPLAAMRCTIARPGLVPYVCTFAGARCADQNFADVYETAVPHSIRYEYQDDIVPHLPPEDAFIAIFSKIPYFSATAGKLIPGYVPLGTLNFINWQGVIVQDSPALQIERISHLAGRMFEPGGFDVIIEDHGIDPGCGYPNAVCPGVWTGD